MTDRPDAPDLVERLEAFAGALSCQHYDDEIVLLHRAAALIREMREALDGAAKRIGTLHGAACDDYDDADWSEVGMSGAPIKHWRSAYVEGINDAGGAFASAMPESLRQQMAETARAASTAEQANCADRRARKARGG